MPRKSGLPGLFALSEEGASFSRSQILNKHMPQACFVNQGATGYRSTQPRAVVPTAWQAHGPFHDDDLQTMCGSCGEQTSVSVDRQWPLPSKPHVAEDRDESPLTQNPEYLKYHEVFVIFKISPALTI